MNKIIGVLSTTKRKLTLQQGLWVIPLSVIRPALFRPIIDLNTKDTLHWDIEVHTCVKSTGKFNYQHARIKVPKELHISNWHLLCGNY